jgi:hypothetical protein
MLELRNKEGRVEMFNLTGMRANSNAKQSEFRQTIASTRYRVARCIIECFADCLPSRCTLNRVQCNFHGLSHKTAFGHSGAGTWLGRFRAFLASTVRDCGPLGLAPRNGAPFRPTGQKENDSVLNAGVNVLRLCAIRVWPDVKGGLETASCAAYNPTDAEICHGSNGKTAQSDSRYSQQHSGHYGFLSLASLKRCYGTNRVLPSDSTLLVGASLFLLLLFLLLRSFSDIL